MKKYFSKITTFLLITLSISTITLAAQQYTVYVNGNKIDGKVIIQDGTTYVPLRALSEALDCKVDVKNGIINVSNTTSSIQTSTPSQPTTPTTPPSNSKTLTQQEMLDCFNQMIKKSSVGDGAYKDYNVTITNYSFPKENQMLIEYKAESSWNIKTYKTVFDFTNIEASKVFANGGLLDGYCGFQTRDTFKDVVEKPKKVIEMFIQDENGMWIKNPEY